MSAGSRSGDRSDSVRDAGRADPPRSSVICIAEDRRAEEAGVRLLIQSILVHVASPQIALWCPSPSPDFKAWVARHGEIELHEQSLSGAGSWNVKAAALLAGLDSGAEAAWWVDSDVLVTRDFIRHYADSPTGELLICEEAAYGSKDGDGIRARGWGYTVGRTYPSGLNTAVLRIGQAHRSLLDTWREKLADPVYQQAQRSSLGERPPHLLGDQDVLTALLCGPFSTVPLRVMWLGVDVIQYFGPPGFTLAERWRYLSRGAPTFVHSQGPMKPWRVIGAGNASASSRDVFERLLRDASPYLGLARHFRSALSPADWRQMRRRSFGGWVLMLLGAGSIALTGLPLAITSSAHALLSRLRRIRGRAATAST